MTDRTVVRKKPRVRRSKGKPEFTFTKEQVLERSEELRESEELRSSRLKAWDDFSRIPMPTLKDEPWRRTDLRNLPVDSVRLNDAAEQAVDPALVEPLAAEEHGAFLSIRPGHPLEMEGVEALTSQGVVFADWPTAVVEHEGLLREHMGSVVPAEEGKFSALTAAMGQDGVLVYVPRGVNVEQPLHSILWAPGPNRAFFSRVLIVVEEGASLTYVHEAASPTAADGDSLHGGIVEAKVAQGARLTFVEVQNWGRHMWNFTHERARVDRDGILDWIFGAVGSKLTKSFMELSLEGQGAEGRMSGFYFADGTQHFDHDTQQNHLAAQTTSDLLFKGALVDQSRSVWQGMIYVAPKAQGTDGYQANRNLILKKGARADSIPGLEIMADDVRCTHGATVSQLEEEPLFYLMSRGLPRKESERLVVGGFFSPIMERVPFDGVRDRFAGMIDEKLV